MQQDRLQKEKIDGGATAQLFFWSGQQDLANQLADRLGVAAPLAFELTAVATALRNGKRAVILWRGPDFALAPCLTQGNPVAPALEDWKDKARRLITLFRKNRHVMILAEAEALRSGGTDALTQRLGVSNIAALPAGEAPSPLGQALARLALDHDNDLRALTEDLVSSSLPMPDLVIAEVLQHVAAQTARSNLARTALQDQLAKAERLGLQAETERLDLKSRADQLREQIQQMEAAMIAQAEAAAQRLAVVEGKLAQNEQKSTALLAEGAAIGTRLAETAAEARSLRLQLDQDRRALLAQSSAAEAAAARIATLESQNARQEEKIASLTTEGDALRATLAQHQAEARDAATRIGDLEAQLEQQEKKASGVLAEAMAISARLADRDAEATILLAQVKLVQTELATQTCAAEGASAQVRALEAKLSEQEATFSVLQAESDYETTLLRTQIDLNQSVISEQSGGAALLISTLEDQLSKQEKTAADLQAERTALGERLAEREAEADLLRAQLNLGQSDLFAQITEAQVVSQAASLRIDALEGLVASQELGATEQEGRRAAAEQQIAEISDILATERRSLDQALAAWTQTEALVNPREGAVAPAQHGLGPVDEIEKALSDEHAKRVAAVAEKTRLAAELANRVAEVALLTDQVNLLQDGLSQVVTSLSDEEKRSQAAASQANAARSEDWDKALAKALAASRSEAERRAKAEQDLEVAKARLQSMDQRREDLTFNRKLFEQMTIEATASLDEIARLQAGRGGAINGSAEFAHPPLHP